MSSRPTLFALACVFTAACNIDPYHLGSESQTVTVDARPFKVDARNIGADGGGSGGGGGGSGDGGIIDTGDAGLGCQPEQCNGKDDDCDGVIDNGFHLDRDPLNCGACGVVCNQAATNQRGTCVEGKCQYACLPGFLDCNESPGCETQCIQTNGGNELCDGLDNNCNCKVDEGFNTDSDPMNCGACGHVCVALHATATCAMGKCGVGACDPGYKDFNPDIPGCEYRCPIFPPKANDVTCDGVDDDCNGKIDDGVTGVGDDCTTGGKGECAAGKFACVNGQPQCEPVHSAVPETCDGKDNDCDGKIDNGFDTQNDPNHCGSTCKMCPTPAHSIPGCSKGVCGILACESGWVSLHGTCDYQCTPSGPEVCDGIDNDCNGKVDEADPGLIRPTNFCNTRGECAGTTPQCKAGKAGCDEAGVTWRCIYGGAAEVDSCGDLLPQETLCDGKDGDCDGVADDAFANINQPCDDGKVGVCRSTGKIKCDPNDPTKKTTTCIIDHQGGSPTAEKCNGLDDDCNGKIDDNASDNMVDVGGFLIMAYEASRPDATASSEGTIVDHACSNPGVVPWNLVSWTDAKAACEKTGKRLCTEPEWEQACGGPTSRLYPYGATYQATTCNGNDYDSTPGGTDDDAIIDTASLSGCVSDWGTGGKAFDMSGNLREWTSQDYGGLKRIRGGAFDNVAEALTCQFDFWTESPSSFYYNLGFRCCEDK